MPTLADHKTSRSTKLLLIGDSGSGKTGALASLANAGYHLRIMDFDNGLEPLIQYTRPECYPNVHFRQFRDARRATDFGPIIDGTPKAFTDATKALNDWGEGLGKPQTWSPDCIVVLDSLTFCGEAAYNWADHMNPTAKDKRQTYFVAQQAISSLLSMLCSEYFRPSVIITAHIQYQESQDGLKGFPTSIGSALNPTIPRYFNHMGVMDKTLAGLSDKNVTPGTTKRTIRFTPTAVVDAKSPLQFSGPLPIETGLADFFKRLNPLAKAAA